MDWSVILDGFVLLMGWVGGCFLLYGLALVFDHLIPHRREAQSPPVHDTQLPGVNFTAD